MHGYDRLSGLDASFLALERVETPMHIGSLAVLEGGPFFDDDGRFKIADARHLVASRLHLIPRFRKRPMSVLFDLGRPIWVDDPRFDVAYHVRLTALPNPGGHGRASVVQRQRAVEVRNDDHDASANVATTGA